MGPRKWVLAIKNPLKWRKSNQRIKPRRTTTNHKQQNQPKYRGGGIATCNFCKFFFAISDFQEFAFFLQFFFFNFLQLSIFVFLGEVAIFLQLRPREEEKKIAFAPENFWKLQFVATFFCNLPCPPPHIIPLLGSRKKWPMGIIWGE